MSLIRLENVYKIYNEGFDNEVRALDGVSLEIDSGEFVAVIGQSGSGKSTMMNILGCLDIPSHGEYYLDGIPVTERSERELALIRSQRIGFIFQGYNLIPSLNVWQNVALPMNYQGIKPADRYDRAMSALEIVDIAEKSESRPSQLSGGQQQRVAIARAVAANSPIIMADEPTGALDSKTGIQVLQMLKDRHKTGTTVILITHDNSIAAQAERIIRLRDGVVIDDGPAPHVAANVGPITGALANPLDDESERRPAV